MQPLFTIIMPAYNHEKFVVSAIRSVLNQTYNNIQFIIIDDGSRDQTPQLINKLKQQHPGKFLFLQQKNHGVGFTLNRGLRLAKGKYFYYLASDDQLSPTTIETVVRVFEKLSPPVGFLHCQVWHQEKEIPKKLGNMPAVVNEGKIWKKVLLNQVESILGPACFFKTAYLKKVKGFSNTLPLEDFYILLKMGYHYESCYLPAKILLHRHHANNTAHQYRLLGPAIIKTIRIFFQEYRLSDKALMRRAMAIRYYNQFWTGFNNHDRSWALQNFWRYFLLTPLKAFCEVNTLKALLRTVLHVFK